MVVFVACVAAGVCVWVASWHASAYFAVKAEVSEFEVQFEAVA